MPPNSKRLTVHFPNLTVRDRFRLIMAARQRFKLEGRLAAIEDRLADRKRN